MVVQLVNSVLYDTKIYITVFTEIRSWILFWATQIQSTSSHIYLWFILILSSLSLIGLPSGLFPLSSMTKILYVFIISLMRAIYPTYIIFPDFMNFVIFS
jgi:hypothetical protein